MKYRLSASALEVIRLILMSVVLMAGILLVTLAAVIWRYSQSHYPLSDHQSRIEAPPMGWNSWNAFACDENLNEQVIKEQIDRIVNDGYLEAGYQYVVIDDCWQLSRNAKGEIQVDQKRFPGGIKALAEYAHQKGLLFGIYTSAGRETCMMRPGSYGYEERDIKTYTEWQVDFIKLDWCGVENLDTQVVYKKWRQLLNETNRPIILSIAIAKIYEAYDAQVWLWGDDAGDMWRVASDLQDDWSQMLRVFDVNARYAPYQRSGGWNDADMLQVGNGGMTFVEYRTHFGLWAIQSSPLMLGTDLRTISPELKSIVTNRDAISVNQDKLGLQGEVVVESGPIQVISKPLYNRGSRAVMVINRSEAPQKFSLTSSHLRLLPLMFFQVIWPDKHSRFVYGSYTITLAPHDSLFVIASGIDMEKSLVSLLPHLDGQVRSGNLARQTAFEGIGRFEYDNEFQQGISLAIKNHSDIRYHLNAQCHRLKGKFEYVRSERANTMDELGFYAELYLDGKEIWAKRVKPSDSSASFDVSVENGRVLDLVTHAKNLGEGNQYGRWKQPIIECLDAD